MLYNIKRVSSIPSHDKECWSEYSSDEAAILVSRTMAVSLRAYLYKGESSEVQVYREGALLASFNS